MASSLATIQQTESCWARCHWGRMEKAIVKLPTLLTGSEAQDAVTVRQLQNAIGAVTTTPTKYHHANSTEEDSPAVGTDSSAMGAKTNVNADAGIGIGLNTLVMADAINGIAIGSNARANHANSIARVRFSDHSRRTDRLHRLQIRTITAEPHIGEFSVGSEDVNVRSLTSRRVCRYRCR